MLETNLVKAICSFLEDSLNDLSLETEGGGFKPPQIVNGYLPPKRKNEEDDFPFVIVRPENGTSELGSTDCTVSLIVGCYSEGMDGYEYCLSVMQHIRQALMSMEMLTLEKRYQLAFPIKWKNTDQQPYPFWQLEMTTEWTFNTPQFANF